MRKKNVVPPWETCSLEQRLANDFCEGLIVNSLGLAVRMKAAREYIKKKKMSELVPIKPFV